MARPKSRRLCYVVNTLSQAQLPLTIENEGIKVEFPPPALAVQELQGGQDTQRALEIGAREVTLQEKEAILAATHPQESSGLFALCSESLGAYVKWFPGERKVEIIR